MSAFNLNFFNFFKTIFFLQMLMSVSARPVRMGVTVLIESTVTSASAPLNGLGHSVRQVWQYVCLF